MHEKNNVLLSLCIATDGKVNLVLPAIESIYSQGVDNNLFEVVVTDNGDKDDLETAIKQFSYSNFHYYRTQAVGFTNQITAVEKSTGAFIKLVSHRCRMLPGSIEELISMIEHYKSQKPIVFCGDGYIKSEEIVDCNNINDFVKVMSFMATWAGGTCVWREDLVNYKSQKINEMFPHTLFLFQLRKESKYVIWNKKITTMVDDRKKGGYNFYHTFAVDFMDIIHELRITNKISIETFLKTKKELFNFLTDTYIIEKVIPSRHKYILSGIKSSMSVHFGALYYYYMILFAYLILPYKVFRKLVLGKSVLER